MLEKDIQKAIIEYLNASGFWVWRNNTGAMVLEGKNGKKRFFRAGFPGISDIIGIAPDGRFVAIEVKRKGGKVTQNQQAFLNAVRGMGAYGIVAYSLDDAMEFVKQYNGGKL